MIFFFLLFYFKSACRIRYERNCLFFLFLYVFWLAYLPLVWCMITCWKPPAIGIIWSSRSRGVPMSLAGRRCADFETPLLVFPEQTDVRHVLSHFIQSSYLISHNITLFFFYYYYYSALPYAINAKMLSIITLVQYKLIFS